MRKILTVAAIFISSYLSAQDSTNLLGEVTVTATKYSTKTTETGKVVTLISRQQIEHAGSRDLAQVISELGGVFINGYTNNPGKEKNIYLRGARVDYTLITIDGVPVYDASGIGSNFDIRNIPIDNVERIEILKGSQSTLYGSDAIAGVINIITRKTGSKPFSISGTAHYGSYDSKRLNTTVSGNKGLLNYSVGFTHYSTDGFSEAKQPAGSSTTFDKDGYKQNALQASLGIKAGKALHIQPFIRWSRNRGSLDQDAFIDELDHTYAAENLQTGASNVITLKHTQVNISYQYNRTYRDYLDDSTKSRNGYYTYSKTVYKAKEQFAEAFLVQTLDDFKLTLGTELRASKTDYEGLNVIPPFPPYSPDAITQKQLQSGDSVNQQQFAAYAALNYRKNEFSMEGGGRLNHHSVYGNNFAFNFNPSYFLQKKIKLFVNASSGYKTPSLFQLFSEYGNRDLKPETSINIESGLQYFAPNNNFNARATWFNRSTKDVIAFFFDPVTYRSRYINQDRQKDHGFELETSATVVNKVQLKLLYSYVTGNITTIQNGKDTTYFNLLRRPKSNLVVSAGSQLSKALYIMLQASATGSSRDIYYDASFQPTDIRLNNYYLLNLYTEYALNTKLKIFADIRNLTDQKYSDVYGYNTAGFNAYGGIRFRL
ncbi:MAG TPA: TonB-dependent receptor [Flavisolibacter sp.]|nr:TonB-dependent receptor [Flavisolibacter sp.]